ncbi:MAG: GspH/FimT family protein [Gammaproteobacteria bacterium]|nr:GspH/FimT family protein [Gammaproteobacteria bacterium]
MKKTSGYSLLELLITLALVAAVFAIGIPSMNTFIQNDRLVTQINTLVGHLSYARSEAVKRSQQVGVCVSSNSTTCTGGNSWEDGWIIYVDIDGDGAFTAGETVLRAQQQLEGANTLGSGTIGTQVTYDYRGFVDAASVGSFSLCDDRGASYGKAISISPTGRVRSGGGVSC